MKRIAIIIPSQGEDYLKSTVLDGLSQLSREGHVEFRVSSILKKDEFADYACVADLILIIWWGKKKFDLELVERINRWERTVFIDGSEVGSNNGMTHRYDFDIQYGILSGTDHGPGAPNQVMLKQCALYFRREKPYGSGIMPLPYGIEERYTKYYDANKEKDIDFACMFGQDEYPRMRRHAKKLLTKWCDANGFTYRVEPTKTADEFYQLLARAKVGVSIGGGGYDTARFWEILANNCLVLCERIDIFQPDSGAFDYERIWEFNNLYDFQYQLEKIGEFLRTGYTTVDLTTEYNAILETHGAKARVLTILYEARKKGII